VEVKGDDVKDESNSSNSNSSNIGMVYLLKMYFNTLIERCSSSTQ
jgi:hypothetical protein